MSWLFSQCSRYRLITLHAAVVPSDLSHLSATLSSSMDSADVHLNFSYDGIINLSVRSAQVSMSSSMLVNFSRISGFRPCSLSFARGMLSLISVFFEWHGVRFCKSSMFKAV